MKQILGLMLLPMSVQAMEHPNKNNEDQKNCVPHLRILCLEYIALHGFPRSQSSLNLVEQVAMQENIYNFYLSRGLNLESVTRMQSLIKKNIKVTQGFKLIPTIFQKWITSSIETWKSAGALEPFTALLRLITAKNLTNQQELFEALNTIMQEQPSSYALPEFLIQSLCNNDLSKYPYANVIIFPPCKETPTLELKQFMKKVILAHLTQELKNSMLRRAVHQKIYHNQLEYEPIICCLIENGAVKTILSNYEQKNLTCAT
ncbi:hypothetical protein BH09DEP1_BH09DEP1_7670 [soil metagenome]